MYASHRVKTKLKQSKAEIAAAHDILAAAGKTRYDAEERKAIKTSKRVGFEPRSEDSASQDRTMDGYGRENGFVCSDDSDTLLSDSDEDDDTSCWIGSDAESIEGDGDAQIREDTVALVLSKYGTFAISAKASGPLVLVRRTGKSRYIEILLDNWMRDTTTVHVEDVDAFIKILKFQPQEAIQEIYMHLVCAIRRRSVQLYRCLYECIVRCLPKQLRFIKSSHKKYKTAPAAAAAVQKRKPKPTVAKPNVQNIHDIIYVCGTFATHYARYVYDHEQSDYDHCSLFACLTPDQQSTLSRLSSRSLEDIEALDTESQLDIFRRLFGTKSSGACIAEIAGLKFVGNALDPAAWAIFHVAFHDLLNKTPRDVRPPEAELAKRLVYACPMLLLRADVQARRPLTLRAAFDTIMERLNDAGFLRSAAQQAQGGNGQPRPTPPIYSNRGELLQGERRGQQAGRQEQRYVDPSTPRTASSWRQTTLPTTLTPMARTAAPPTAPLQRKPYPPCSRCKKSDHPEEACISKHDVDNVRLAPLPDDVYGRHKAAYFKLKELAKAAVVDEPSPRTSDEETFDEYEYEEECDCVCVTDTLENAILPIQSPAANCGCLTCTHVAAYVPSAPLVGVEPNPGPIARRERNKLAAAKLLQLGRVQPKFEMTAPASISHPFAAFPSFLVILCLHRILGQTLFLVDEPHKCNGNIYLDCAYIITIVAFVSVLLTDVSFFQPRIEPRHHGPPAPRLVCVELNPGPEPPRLPASTDQRSKEVPINSGSSIVLIRKGNNTPEMRFVINARRYNTAGLVSPLAPRLINTSEWRFVTNAQDAAGLTFPPAPRLIGVETNPGPPNDSSPYHIVILDQPPLNADMPALVSDSDSDTSDPDTDSDISDPDTDSGQPRSRIVGPQPWRRTIASLPALSVAGIYNFTAFQQIWLGALHLFVAFSDTIAPELRRHYSIYMDDVVITGDSEIELLTNVQTWFRWTRAHPQIPLVGIEPNPARSRSPHHSTALPNAMYSCPNRSQPPCQPHSALPPLSRSSALLKSPPYANPRCSPATLTTLQATFPSPQVLSCPTIPIRTPATPICIP
jgi:hypothetical protein